MKTSFIFSFLFLVKTVGAQDTTLQQYQKFFEKELKDWASCFSNFKLSDFKKTDTRSFDNNYPQNFNYVDSFLSVYAPLMEFNKDKSGFIDIYSYQLSLEKKGNSYVASPDVDQAILLCDRKTKYWNRIFFGTPSCYIYDVTWITNNKFILVGSSINTDEKFGPVIILGDANTQLLEFFANTNKSCVEAKHYASKKLKSMKIEGLD